MFVVKILYLINPNNMYNYVYSIYISPDNFVQTHTHMNNYGQITSN